MPHNVEKNEKPQAYKGYDLHFETENALLQAYNRAQTMANLLKDTGKEDEPEKYFAFLSMEEQALIKGVLLMVAKFGKDETKKRILAEAGL